MNVKFQNGEITFGLHEVLERIDPASKVELIESLSCDDAIIKHVSDQIIRRWTENLYSGAAAVTAHHEPSCALDVAWRAVAKASGDVAKREIERLESALKQKSDECWRLISELSERSSNRY